MIKHCLRITSLLLSLSTALPACAAEVFIDVRSIEENTADHINGDANIPLASLDAATLAAKYGKDAELVLYCRSGNRAGQAKTILEAAGFTHVSNGGSIGEVRKLRHLAEPVAAPAK